MAAAMATRRKWRMDPAVPSPPPRGTEWYIPAAAANRAPQCKESDGGPRPFMNIQIRGGIRGTEQLGLDLVTEASPLNEYSIKGQTSGKE